MKEKGRKSCSMMSLRMIESNEIVEKCVRYSSGNFSMFVDP